MRKAAASGWALAGAVLAALVACTNTYLYDERRDLHVPVDRTLAVEGRFCTVGTNEVVQPIKILIAMDASQSMNATDPDNTRGQALKDLLEALPNEPEVYISVMTFAGSITQFLTNNFLPGFVPLQQMTTQEKNLLISRLLNAYIADGGVLPNRDSTDFVKPLADIYEAINSDIAMGRLNATSTTAQSHARYSVIFLSDGHPTQNQDIDLLKGDAVVRIRQLKELVEDVRFNTVFVFNPVQPVSSVCDLSGDAGTGCPLLLINEDSERLRLMAGLGGGDFRDFRNHEPINFLTFRFGQVRRSFQVKELVLTNLSTPAGSPPDAADSDGDGLTDEEEATVRTNPLKVDTDGDGFSDKVEVYFRARGARFTPNQVPLPDGGNIDPGCPPALRGVDSDCDGLRDCDEQLIGTDARRVDSDDDGVPDSVEWQLGTQGSSPDLDQDPDNDGLMSRAEVRLHTDPNDVDSEKLSDKGYRYRFTADGPVDSEGRQCFEFRIENVFLANTLADTLDGGSGLGAGYNDLYLSYAMIPSDDAQAKTLVRGFRTQVARYPVGGIKSPPDGVIQVAPEDFVDGCGQPGP